MMKNLKNYKNPFSATIVEKLKRAQREREQRAAIYEETRAVVERAFNAQFLDIRGAPVSETARAILLAGMRRRNEIVDERTLPKKGSLAEKIVNAGRARRGEPQL
jgi:hypothetical protein